MTKKEKEKNRLLQAMDDELKEIRRDYEAARAWHEKNAPDGWNAPPRQLPRAGELAMGKYYDPDWNTR